MLPKHFCKGPGPLSSAFPLSRRILLRSSHPNSPSPPSPQLPTYPPTDSPDTPNHPPTHIPSIMPPSREEQYKHLSDAISRVVTPVMICMGLAVWFVHSLGDRSKCVAQKSKRKLGEILLFPEASPDNTSNTTYTPVVTIIFIVAFIFLMVIFTFLIVWLYKTGRRKFIKGWLMLAVFLIFAYVGGLYIFDFCRSRCFVLDWITLCLAVWNFTITGLYAVFGRVPRLINQAYLIIMSALMAYIFRTLPSYAVWIILGVLVIWDLFAVLSPYGPLRMLVDAARSQQDELPALVYDTNPTDAGREPATTASKTTSIRDKSTRAPRSTTASPQDPTPPPPSPGHIPPDASTPAVSVDADVHPDRRRRRRSPLSLFRLTRRSQPTSPTSTIQPTDHATLPADTPASASSTVPAAAIHEPSEAVVVDMTTPAVHDAPNEPIRNTTEGGATSPATATGTGTGTGNTTNRERARGEQVQIGTIGTHLKLGLGDFVFYSILVAEASKSSAMTAVSSFVAILAGLCATLFLVTVYRKALPALPISITMGLLFYFLTRHTVQPFINNLIPELLFH